MKSLSIVTALIIAFSTIALAQAPDTAWTRSYNRDSWDEGRWISETSDNGFVMVGVSQVSGNTWLDILMIRIDANGDSLWAHTYGDSIINQEGFCVKEDIYNGGYVIAAEKDHTTLLRNGWIIKTDDVGDTIWTYLYGGSNNAESWDVICTSDSGYAVTGVRYDSGQFGNAYLLKLDKDGAFEWSRTFGGSGYEDGHSVEQTADGGYMVAGQKDVSGKSYDFYLIKTDGDGNTEWAYTYGGDNADLCTSAEQTQDGGYIMYGESDSNIPNTAMALKVNADGDSLWCYNYDRSSGDYGRSVDECSDGGFIFGGFSNNVGYLDDYWFLRTDSNGDTLWSTTVGYGDYQRGYCIEQTNDGGYILCGYSANTGPTWGDFYVVKLNASASGIDDENYLPEKLSLLQNYPNPFNASTTIKYSLTEPGHISLTVYDVLGNKVATLVDADQTAGNHEALWNADDYASGMYMYKITGDGFTVSRKMILLK